jgi:hypothetical protein
VGVWKLKCGFDLVDSRVLRNVHVCGVGFVLDFELGGADFVCDVGNL